jgi:hypothetical protein
VSTFRRFGSRQDRPKAEAVKAHGDENEWQASSSKKPGKKRPTIKKLSKNPKRTVRGQSELTQVVARLEALAESLTQTAERLAQSVRRALGTQPPANPTAAVLHRHDDEHADDIEVASYGR